MTREGFPLQWPNNIQRSTKLIRSQFKTTVESSRKGILNQIKLLKGVDAIITTNVPLRKDGQMYADIRPVAGELAIAVYFTWSGIEYVIACDNYDRLQDNLRAAEKIIEAIRGIERWGNKATVERAFKGFKAELPKFAGTETETCWSILNVPENSPAAVIKAAYREKTKHAHPDVPGGSAAAFLKLSRAFEEAIKTV